MWKNIVDAIPARTSFSRIAADMALLAAFVLTASLLVIGR
jgi:hypothetical protein